MSSSCMMPSSECVREDEAPLQATCTEAEEILCFEGWLSYAH